MLTEMDVMPTLVKWLGVPGPALKTDGKDVTDLLLGKAGARSPHEAVVFYAGSELQAIRSGDWKLHFEHPYITPHAEPGRDGKPSNWEHMKPAAITQSGIQGIATRHGYKVAQQAPALYNLREDISETTDVSAGHPDVVERLKKLAEPLRLELGDTLTGTPPQAVRPLGRDDG
jgi:arylsulfatase A-like enzyme